MSNILIACSFFVIGAIVGGVLALRACWNEMMETTKKRKKAQSDPLIIRVYGTED